MLIGLRIVLEFLTLLGLSLCTYALITDNFFTSPIRTLYSQLFLYFSRD